MDDQININGRTKHLRLSDSGSHIVDARRVTQQRHLGWLMVTLQQLYPHCSFYCGQTWDRRTDGTDVFVCKLLSIMKHVMWNRNNVLFNLTFTNTFTMYNIGANIHTFTSLLSLWTVVRFGPWLYSEIVLSRLCVFGSCFPCAMYRKQQLSMNRRTHMLLADVFPVPFAGRDNYQWHRWCVAVCLLLWINVTVCKLIRSPSYGGGGPVGKR